MNVSEGNVEKNKMICTTIRKGKECPMMRKGKCIINNECKTIIEKCIGCSNIETFNNKHYCSRWVFPKGKWDTGGCDLATHLNEEVRDTKK